MVFNLHHVMDPVNPHISYEEAFRRAVQEAFNDLHIAVAPIIERPRSGHSDLCLVVFQLVKELGKNPQEITDMVKDAMGTDKRWTLEASGGYLNCIFDKDRFTRDTAAYIWSFKDSPGAGDPTGIRVVVEHTSANPNGPFHVGRARNPVIGDTLVRLLRLAGNQVEAQYWVNDMGKQVMILVWGLKNIDLSDLEETGRDKTDHRLVRYYQAANSRMEEDPDVDEQIGTLLKNYEEAVRDGEWDRLISPVGCCEVRAGEIKDACNGVLEGMVGSLARMGVSLDRFVYESRVVEDHSLWDVIEGLKRSPLCREEDGAFYLDLSDLIKGGDDDKFKRRFVFTRSDGSALYTTRDLAYHKWKLDGCDRAINILGEDHRYQSLMLDLALDELGTGKKPEAVFYSFVSLPEGKMSTRRNRVVFLDDLLDEAVDRAREEVENRREDLDPDELQRIAHIVGIGALRFNIVKVQPEKKIVFRWEEALNFDGATAPFVQYSHARACSILRNHGSGVDGKMDWSKLVEKAEKDLVKKLAEFPLVVQKAAEDRKVHLIPQYLVEVSSGFNEFYRDCPVLNEKDRDRMMARLALVMITRNVLSTGLETLGITAPEMM
jgi:arginyl-tRNA synthetase